MGRSVVRKGAPRCPECRHPLGSCACAHQRQVALPFAVDVLIHYREAMRPTSTGSLIGRLVPGARVHAWHSLDPLDPATLARPCAERWVLHPSGEEIEAGVPPPASLQVLLLDGSWTQARALLRRVSGWGRPVRLPAAVLGPPRYWLRVAPAPGHLCTLEALAAVAETLGHPEEARALRQALEVHVLHGLRARGQHDEVRRYLDSSEVLDPAAFSLAKS